MRVSDTMSGLTEMAKDLLNSTYETYYDEDRYQDALEWLDGTFYNSKTSIGYGMIKDWFIGAIQDYGHAETMSKWFKEALFESIDVEDIEKEIIKVRYDIEINIEYAVELKLIEEQQEQEVAV